MPCFTNHPIPGMNGSPGAAAFARSRRCCSRIDRNFHHTHPLNHPEPMKTHITLLTIAVASLSAFAADLTGTWKAEFDTQRGLQKYTFTIKQDGKSVTGKANVEREGEKREAELKEGKVEGDTITFVEPLKIQDNELQITYTGKVSGNEIKFTRKVGDFGSSEATAKRDGAGIPAQAASTQSASPSSATNAPEGR